MEVKQILALMIPILALCIPVFAIIGSFQLKLQKAKLESQRLGTGADQALLHEVDELRNELSQVKTELTEVQERLDFTERLLTSGDRGQPRT